MEACGLQSHCQLSSGTRGDTFENGILFEEVELGGGKTGLWMHHFVNIWGVEGISEKYNLLGALEQGC